eukprot:TRINITY_DN6920_c0_g1_i1.p1 TRINITY_DN6920_c0_g1~~TRINITY_DN6920_c0_g1_i1.p1  ORF type:complete len:180 (-),score=25.47 TRINITY_DN6920_c0_g1_i1:267-806(-)
MALERFCFCYILQRGTFFSTILSSLWWTTLGALYIPYILYVSPSVHVRPGDASSPEIPDDPYCTGLLAAVLIISALFVDALAIAGLYRGNKIKHELIVPWLMFYPLIVVTFLSFGLWNLFAGVYPLFVSGIPLLIGILYVYIWITMYCLFINDYKNRILLSDKLRESTRQPLSMAQPVA